MKKMSFILVVLSLFTINLTAFAQEDEEERDVLEVCFHGGVGVPTGALSDWHDSLGAKSGWNFGIDIGYFARPNLVVGINFQYTQFGIDGDEDASKLKHRLYNPNLFAKYYFVGESNLEPYIKAYIGVENPKFTSSLVGPKYRGISYDASLAYGIGAGLFYYSADYSGFYIEFNYHNAATADVQRVYDEQTLEFGDNLSVLDIHAGVRILIGSGD